MEDELEDRLLYQTYSSHMKLLSRISLGAGAALDAPVAFCWRLTRLYLLRTETVVFGLALIVFYFYLHSVELWSRTLLSRLAQAVGSTESRRLKLTPSGEEQSWRLMGNLSAVYAIRGRRMHMEDRFIINENIDDTGVSLFAIFDGHGGEFAANYAKDHLIQNLHNKIIELSAFKDGKIPPQKTTKEAEEAKSDPEPPPVSAERKKSFRKSASTAEDGGPSLGITDPQLLAQLAKARPTVTRDVQPSSDPVKIVNVPLSSYVEKGKINYDKLLTDEVLAADRLLVEAAKRSYDIAGTTALIAIMEENHLIVANVGDSRGVMCDLRGNAIPLSFDHKPQQVREQKRIEAAGGYIAFKGVWRVAGILATSRSMGDYPLKDKKFVIADPDILTFDLDDHKPMFVILASDGLWDTFTNEEAVKFVKDRLDESDFGAKSLTLQAYYRGSLDNITVIIINFLLKQTAVASVN